MGQTVCAPRDDGVPHHPEPENRPQTRRNRQVPTRLVWEGGVSPQRDSDSYPNGERRERRLVVVAKELPLKIKRIAAPTPQEGEEPGEPTFSIDWDDARNFLANLRVLKEKDSGVDVWFVGTPAITVDGCDREALENALLGFQCVPVFLDHDLKQRFFNGFCKSVMWPMLHYVLPHTNPDWATNWDGVWNAYNTANLQYAQAAARTADEQHDTIWVHNYHLFMVPAFLRNKLPKSKIGLFVHTPWMSSDVYRVLPSRDNILRAMLCADVIGFHTFDYVRHFLSCAKRCLGLDFETRAGGRMGIPYMGRTVSILVSHVGIDSEFFAQRATHPDVIRKSQLLAKQCGGRRVVMGVDDLDLVKGSILKFQAFERFLTTYPDWASKICMFDILLPGSGNKEEKQFVREHLMKKINNIKDKFGPDVIRVEEQDSMTIDDTVALYMASEVGLMSTFWDGLNVAPYEYTACQKDSNPGVLIVSEFMGCSRSLSGVLSVNPWRLEEVSEALHTALTMTKTDKQGNHARRYSYVMQHTAKRWAQTFIRALDESSNLAVDLSFIQVGFGSTMRLVGLKNTFRHLEEKDCASSYRAAGKRVILCDYDGTLTAPSDRGYNGPGDAIKRTLKTLSNDPKNTVFVVSGRSKDYLSQWFGELEELGLAAEKGTFLRWPKKMRSVKQSPHKEWDSQCEGDTFVWMETALEVIEEYKQHTDGSWVEKKESAIVWHFENADPDFGRMQANDMEKYLTKVIPANIEVVIYDYNRIVEVKPRGIGKGPTAKHILTTALKCEDLPNSKEEKADADGPNPGSASSNASLPLASPLTPMTPGHFMAGAPFLLCIGDDKSDEEMYTVAQRSHLAINEREDVITELRAARAPTPRRKYDPSTFTVCVGMKPSNAQYYLHDHEEVHELLAALASLSTGHSHRKSFLFSG